MEMRIVEVGHLASLGATIEVYSRTAGISTGFVRQN